jgi:hypothetical protein
MGGSILVSTVFQRLQVQYATSNLKFGIKTKPLTIIFKMKPYPTFNSQNYTHNEQFLSHYGDLEECMQLGVSTSLYIGRVVTGLPGNVLIPTAMGLRLPPLSAALTFRKNWATGQSHKHPLVETQARNGGVKDRARPSQSSLPFTITPSSSALNRFHHSIASRHSRSVTA